jgi:hypothetical protein
MNEQEGSSMGSFVFWGVVGVIAGTAVSAVFAAWWVDSRTWRAELARKRRAARNQKWVRDKCRANGIMDLDAEAKLLMQARRELKDPWKHLSR